MRDDEDFGDEDDEADDEEGNECCVRAPLFQADL